MAVINGDGADNDLIGVFDEPNEINGYGGADYIEGGEFGDILIGGRGNDFIQGFDGDDLLFGEAGKNIIVAGGGDDQICADGGRASDRNDVLGEAGDDAFNAAAPSADFFDGGSGQDLVSYRTIAGSVTVNLATGRGAGGAAGDRYFSVEDIYSWHGDDVLIGNEVSNRILGRNGDDLLRGGAGGDFLDGGHGNDTLDYRGSEVGVRVNLQTGAASGGDAVGDLFGNVESVIGSAFDDRLAGDGNRNRLDGGGGRDRLAGGAGADELAGGRAADRFLFGATVESAPSRADTILDFSRRQGDVVVLEGIDADTSAAGNQRFTFAGRGAFAGASDELRYRSDGDDAVLRADVNGDGRADFVLVFAGVRELAAVDFVL